jgi:four helix bundle protein
MYVQSFKELYVWQKAFKLVKEVYYMTSKLPREELYVMVSQMRRAAISISSNIAEGKKRKTIKDFLYFLRIADSSASELESQLLIAKEIYITIDFSKAFDLLEQIQKMLCVMIQKLHQLPPKS